MRRRAGTRKEGDFPWKSEAPLGWPLRRSCLTLNLEIFPEAVSAGVSWGRETPSLNSQLNSIPGGDKRGENQVRAAASAFVCAWCYVTASHPLPLLRPAPGAGGPASNNPNPGLGLTRLAGRVHKSGRERTPEEGVSASTGWVFGTSVGQPKGCNPPCSPFSAFTFP